MSLRPLAALAASLLLAACTPASTTPSPGRGTSPPAAVELTVFAAASLKGVLEEAGTAYQASVPGTVLTITTGSSATLRAQIEQGAPADVFLSADSANPAALVAAGLADGAAVDFAGNDLVVIVPKGDPAGIATPADLARDGVKIVAAGTGVPITKYAGQVVDRLAAQAGYPLDFATRYAANVVSREDDARAVLVKIELGEGDAAIAYRTDAQSSGKVSVVEIPDAANVIATYAGVVVLTSRHAGAGHAFLAWLAGPEGRAILAAFGFRAAP